MYRPKRPKIRKMQIELKRSKYFKVKEIYQRYYLIGRTKIN